MSDSIGNSYVPRSQRLCRAFCEGRRVKRAGGALGDCPYLLAEFPEEYRSWVRGFRSYTAGAANVLNDNCASSGLFNMPVITAVATGKSVQFTADINIPVDYSFGDNFFAFDLDGSLTRAYARSGTYTVQAITFGKAQTFTVDVDLLVTSGTLGPFSVEEDTAADFDLTGGWTAGEAPYTYTTASTLPAALVLGATTGHITGTATAAPGTTSVTVTCTDNIGTALSQTFDIEITAA